MGKNLLRRNLLIPYIFSVSAAISGVVVQAQGKPVVREFTPTSSWTVDRVEQTCRVTRDFQNGDDNVRLEFYQIGPWIPLTIRVSSNTLAKADTQTPAQVNSANSADTIFVATFNEAVTPENNDGKVRMTSGSAFPTIKHQVDFAADGRTGMAFKAYLAQPPSTEKDFPEGAETSVIASNVFNENIAMVTGSLMQPITSLLDCSIRLPELWAPDMTPPDDLQKWPQVLSPKSFPNKWARNDWQGAVDYWLVVDKRGHRLNCIVDPMSSAPHEMLMEFCDRLPQSGHTPALNKKGEPVKAAGFRSLMFTLY